MQTLAKRFRALLKPKQLQVEVLTLLIVIVLLSRSYIEFKKSFTATHSIDSCILLGINPAADDLWQFSTRSLCLSSGVCFDPANPGATLYHASDLSKTQCDVCDPDLKPTPTKFPQVAILNGTRQTCQSFQRHFVHCAHGFRLVRAMPVCPEVHKLPSDFRKSARWLEHISVIVPDYAFSKNIYHYLNPISDLARTVENLPELLKRKSFNAGLLSSMTKLNIVFQGPRNVPLAHLWKQQLLELIIRERILKKGIDVDLFFMEDFSKDASPVCFREAVLLGRRGHYNVWPFPNKTEAPLHGFSVPRDAVTFKQAIYDGFGIKSRLPKFAEAQSGHSFSELPPFTVGYAKREGRPGSDGYYRGGAMRKFSAEDEKWFAEMLRNETEAVGAELITILPKSRESLEEQVKDIIQIGFMVGIHGANLVNGIFMHPFGVLMEIMPKNATEECYIAGANSGLKYLRMECSEEVSLLDSGCHPQDFLCKVDPRQRGVTIRVGEDRERIQLLVKQGLGHLQLMKRRFPDGIPVVYNADTLYYDIEK
ncbi:unnamed protein product [Agarophyton chilense]